MRIARSRFSHKAQSQIFVVGGGGGELKAFIQSVGHFLGPPPPHDDDDEELFLLLFTTPRG